MAKDIANAIAKRPQSQPHNWQEGGNLISKWLRNIPSIYNYSIIQSVLQIVSQWLLSLVSIVNLPSAWCYDKPLGIHLSVEPSSSKDSMLQKQVACWLSTQWMVQHSLKGVSISLPIDYTFLLRARKISSQDFAAMIFPLHRIFMTCEPWRFRLLV